MRPVHWLVFMQGDKVVPCELMGAKAGKQSHGHRFHHPGTITIGKAAEYVDALAAAKVIADFTARRDRIRQQVASAAAAVGGRADIDDALLDEVTALVEWPMPITASFEAKYLEVPSEALIYTMKKQQRYFPLLDGKGKLMNRFITIANIESRDPDVIRDGNERVVRPRLADAMFFWQLDGKQKLADHLEATKQVVFQQQLGSMYDKSLRVSKLAAAIAKHIGGDAALAERAGLLSRCDLMTATVGEFAEMQGVMGRHQARRDGEVAELASALDEFYMPRFSGDQLPQTKTGIAVALADKLDSLLGIFGVGMKPSGDKDPFALRRAALGVLRIIKTHRLGVDLHRLLAQTGELLADKIDADAAVAVYDFMLSRLKVLYSDEGRIGAGVYSSSA